MHTHKAVHCSPHKMNFLVSIVHETLYFFFPCRPYVFSWSFVLPVHLYAIVYLGIGFVCSNLNHYISTLRLYTTKNMLFVYASTFTFLFLHTREVTLNAFAHTCSTFISINRVGRVNVILLLKQFLYSICLFSPLSLSL